MTLIRKSDNYPLFPSVFDTMFPRDLMDWSSLNFTGSDSTLPAINVKESDENYEIEVAAPGMKKEDFKIEIDNGQLKIFSEKKEEKSDEVKGKYTRKEFSYRSFQRSFSLPVAQIDSDKIEAKYCDGILCVLIPKREEVKPRPARTIDIH